MTIATTLQPRNRPRATTQGDDQDVFGLTPRELEIVSAVAEARTNNDIAELHGICVSTVKHHITRIFDKLGVHNRMELALFALNRLPETTMNRETRVDLSKDPAGRAALTILTGDLLGQEPRVWDHIDLERGEIRFNRMLQEGTMNGDKRRMVEIAASLFNHNHRINLSWALGTLEAANAKLVVEAIEAFCE